MSETERERRRRIGYFFGKLGVAWVAATIVLEVLVHLMGMAELPRHVVNASFVFGAVVGWWGFFWAEPKRAKEGGTWVMDAADRFHAHRRRDDPPLTPPLDPLPLPPFPPPPPEAPR